MPWLDACRSLPQGGRIMVLRRTGRAGGVLAMWMFSAIAGAQPPVENPPAVTTNPAGTPPAATSYPSDNSSYLLGNGESFNDGQELGPQYRFQADWVFFTRQNRAKSIPVFSGPESVNQ